MAMLLATALYVALPVAPWSPWGVATDAVLLGTLMLNGKSLPLCIGMHVGFKIIDDHERLIHEGRGALLATAIGPGETLTATVVLPTLPHPGRYRVLFDMVEEGHCWFYQAGSEPWEEELTVHE